MTQWRSYESNFSVAIEKCKSYIAIHGFWGHTISGAMMGCAAINMYSGSHFQQASSELHSEYSHTYHKSEHRNHHFMEVVYLRNVTSRRRSNGHHCMTMERKPSPRRANIRTSTSIGILPLIERRSLFKSH